MARPDKVAVVDAVRERFTESTATVLTEYRGLTVSELAELRAELRKSEAAYAVVKNTLTRLAARDAGIDIPDELLVGPTAITFCAGDPVAAAKVLRQFSRGHPELVVKGAVLDGKLLDAAETLRLADLESREELLARLAGMFQTVVAQPARLAQANLSKAARLFAALQDKLPADPEADAGESPASGDAAPADTDTSDAAPADTPDAAAADTPTETSTPEASADTDAASPTASADADDANEE